MESSMLFLNSIPKSFKIKIYIILTYKISLKKLIKINIKFYVFNKINVNRLRKDR